MTFQGVAKRLDYHVDYSKYVRQKFVDSGYIIRLIDEDQPRFPKDREPVFAFNHRFESGQTGAVLYTIGTTQEPANNYLIPRSEAELQPWWATQQCYGSLDNMLKVHYNDYNRTQVEAARWQSQLKADVISFYANENANTTTQPRTVVTTGWQNGTDQFGQPYVFDPDNGFGYMTPNLTHGVAIPFMSEADSYYAILALSTRQTLASNVIRAIRGQSQIRRCGLLRVRCRLRGGCL